MYNPEININNQAQEIDENSIINEIMDLFGPDKLPLGHPKWKLIIDNIKDEEYEPEELVAILAEVKNAFAKLDKIDEDFFENNFDKSLSEKDIEIARKEIKKIVESIKNGEFENIGSGNSATVFLDEDYPNYCFKVLKNTAIDNPGVNTVKEEGEYLDTVSNLEVNGIRAPKPYYYHIDKKNDLAILVMETFDAVDLKDVLEGKAPLPDEFDFEKSYNDLEQYFIKLNNEKRINHNDAFIRNLMIDVNNACFRVIDFGKSTIREQEHDGISGDLRNIRKLKQSLKSILNI